MSALNPARTYSEILLLVQVLTTDKEAPALIMAGFGIDNICPGALTALGGLTSGAPLGTLIISLTITRGGNSIAFDTPNPITDTTAATNILFTLLFSLLSFSSGCGLSFSLIPKPHEIVYPARLLMA
jgi:hypothetical protein